MKLLTDYKQPNTEVYWGKWGQWWWSGHIPSLLRNAVYILCLMDCFSGLILRCRMMGLWAVFCFFSISGIVYVMLVPCTSSCPALKETPLAAFAPCGPAALPWEKGEHPLEQHSWHGGGGGFCCKAEGMSKYHLLGTNQRSVEWFGAAEMGVKFLIYLPQAEWLQL